MGKKRRLLSGKRKFASKHRNHPRMRALWASDTDTATVSEVVAPVSNAHIQEIVEKVVQVEADTAAVDVVEVSPQVVVSEAELQSDVETAPVVKAATKKSRTAKKRSTRKTTTTAKK